METPKMLTETQFNEILQLIPNSRDRANLVVHHVLTQHKIRDLEGEKAAAIQRIQELSVALDSIHDDLRRAGDVIADQAALLEEMQVRAHEPAQNHQDTQPDSNSRSAEELKKQIVEWLRSGPGAGETVRAKFAAKLANLIESNAHARSASDFAAY